MAHQNKRGGDKFKSITVTKRALRKIVNKVAILVKNAQDLNPVSSGAIQIIKEKCQHFPLANQ